MLHVPGSVCSMHGPHFAPNSPLFVETQVCDPSRHAPTLRVAEGPE
jgi:hypothetical protein